MCRIAKTVLDAIQHKNPCAKCAIFGVGVIGGDAGANRRPQNSGKGPPRNRVRSRARALKRRAGASDRAPLRSTWHAATSTCRTSSRAPGAFYEVGNATRPGATPATVADDPKQAQRVTTLHNMSQHRTCGGNYRATLGRGMVTETASVMSPSLARLCGRFSATPSWMPRCRLRSVVRGLIEEARDAA